MIKKRFAFFMLLFIVSLPAFAQPSMLYFFSSPTQQQLFTKLTTESRCLVCQNQSLADSDAPLAVDLKNIIYTLVQQGLDEKAIQNFLVKRYGNYVLLRPPLDGHTWLLWVSPFLLLALGFGVLRHYVKQK